MTTWTHTSSDSDPSNPTWLYHSSQLCKDGDGNYYSTINIGNQEWMLENLKTTKYNDGTSIPRVTVDDDWTALTTGARSEYNNDASSESDTYGYLYNWYAVDTGNLAPEGWHVPTDDEFKQLEKELGMSESESNGTFYRGTDEGAKLAGRADLWDDGDLDSNSEFGSSGFNILPGGVRFYYGTYSHIGARSYFWVTTEYDVNDSWYRGLISSSPKMFRSDSDKNGGLYVRCVRDTTAWNTLYGGVWNLGSFVAWEDLDKHNWEDWN